MRDSGFNGGDLGDLPTRAPAISMKFTAKKLKAPFFLLIHANSSYIIAGVIESAFPLCIETPGDEVCLGVCAGDLVVVSAPEGGPIEPAVMLLELVRSYHTPVIALPPGHPGSKRVKYVVSCGKSIHLDAGIVRGTHPDQAVLCASPEIAGLIIQSTGERIDLISLPPASVVTLMRSLFEVESVQ
ncbi:MAG: alpha/beta hydrolase [Methanomicrobiales archaeon]|nr:alpha/beta hydrolase [Methanomicrobiales archaeon]